MSVRLSSPTAQAPLSLLNALASAVPLTVKGASGQSSDLTQWQDPTAAVKAAITSDGRLQLNAASTGTSVIQGAAIVSISANSTFSEVLRVNPASVALNQPLTGFGGKDRIVNPADTTHSVIVRSNASQSASPFIVQNSTPSNILSVGLAGDVVAGGSVRATTQLGGTGIMDGGFTYTHISLSTTDTIVNPASASGIALRIRGAASQTGDLLRVENNTPTTLASFDNLGRLGFPGVEAITASAGANAGTSPPTPALQGTCNDVRGFVSFGTGTSTSAGILCHVTFATAYAATPNVVITPTNNVSAALQLYVTNVSTTGFDVGAQVAPAASQVNTVYGFQYATIG